MIDINFSKMLQVHSNLVLLQYSWWVSVLVKKNIMDILTGNNTRGYIKGDIQILYFAKCKKALLTFIVTMTRMKYIFHMPIAKNQNYIFHFSLLSKYVDKQTKVVSLQI